ncbi:30S ribosomal protein S3 [Candidatus Pacearchaeota archaeon]|uniref:30S ribosomal protein S3 n=1 Tax=uncultured organism TaxID=155900 RepID=U3GVV9_9ZZZZ|nr:30S ribosomal protein S3 [uncultured organism]AJS11970.1 30S ribosomal protein S3 [uncultured archaeon]MBS3089435.1 30S ribosomal protein S3 [Candidatus Pacearchaeota archaeon]
MEEKKFVTFKKEELGVREYVKRELGKGRISSANIEYTPVGEKIIIATSKPGLVIGRRGEKIEELTRVLKKRFKLDNPHIEIREITQPKLDAQLVADEIALSLERKGSLKFKVIAYKMLQEIIGTGALGAEIVLSGKLPSERAKSWRFAQGYLKKTGNPAEVVDRAMSQAVTMAGVVGIKVSILPPDAPIHDRIVIDDKIKNHLSASLIKVDKVEEELPKKKSKKKNGGNK